MEHEIINTKQDQNNPEVISPDLSSDTENAYDHINFYLQPEFIKAISQQIAYQPEIDHTKIEKIKQDIANNNFPLHANDLAEKIIKFEDELFKKIT